MEEPKPKKNRKRVRTLRAVQGFIGGKPIFSIVSIFVIVVSCLLMSFSKETIERWEEGFVRKGQEIFGVGRQDPCQEGWNFYEQNVIGISFCYPSAWGKATTEPKAPVTRLAGLLDEFEGTDSAAKDRFYISFENNQDITMMFFNEDYGGEYYPNANAYKYGYQDNIGKLKESGSICDYKLDFNHTWEYEGRINETYAICGNGVKTAIIDDQQYFDKEVHSDALESFAYRKLQNGYFDNLLITSTYGRTVQLEKKFSDLTSLITALGKTREDFDSRQAEFSGFVSSIKAFIPPEKKELLFMESEADNPDTLLIRKYYYLIQAGRLSEAYLLKAEEGRGSYEDFAKQYENAYIASPYDFQGNVQDGYYFYVDYEDHNAPKEKYGVRMRVEDSKIETLFVEKFWGDMVAYGDYSAFAVERSGKMQLILKREGRETIVDQGDAHYDDTMSNLEKVKEYSDIAFSPTGSYLMFTYTGYEWSVSHIYEIASGKLSRGLEGARVGDGLAVTPDEKYLYYCLSSGFFEGVPGKVYALPEMVEVFDAKPGNEAYMDTSCRYDASQQAVIFDLSNPFPEETEPKGREIKFGVE